MPVYRSDKASREARKGERATRRNGARAVVSRSSLATMLRTKIECMPPEVALDPTTVWRLIHALESQFPWHGPG
jgi:hypothetical protein